MSQSEVMVRLENHRSRCVVRTRREAPRRPPRRTALSGLALLCVLLLPQDGHGVDGMSRSAEADSLFRQGWFERAEPVYEDLARENPADPAALLALGRIHLYRNALPEARQWLRKALDLRPLDRAANLLLAEVCCRQNDFRAAAPLYLAGGDTLRARQADYLGARGGYRIEGPDETEVEFLQTDPLPFVRLEVNGGEAVFLIDTGAASLMIDRGLADEVGAERFGERMGTFAGGRQAPVEIGAVERVRLGEFTVSNVPVGIHQTPPFSTADGEPARGILGTSLLYRFLFTFDYPGGKLILRRPTEGNRREVLEHARLRGGSVTPFWMAGDHFIVAWGTINGSAPILFFVDTGLAGGGFLGTNEIAGEAGIQLPEESQEGMGGGGRVSFKRAAIDELTLGEARETAVEGVFGGGPSLSSMLGFRVGGIISHGFFRPYGLTLDFEGMNLVLEAPEGDRIGNQ